MPSRLRRLSLSFSGGSASPQLSGMQKSLSSTRPAPKIKGILKKRDIDSSDSDTVATAASSSDSFSLPKTVHFEEIRVHEFSTIMGE